MMLCPPFRSLLWTACVAAAVPASAQPFLFSYFGDEGAGMLLAYSRDGYTFTALNEGKPLLVPAVGEDKLMRDPCIAQGPDGTFHMVWTVSWKERGIGYAHSKDLVHWSEQTCFHVMADEPTARNCWAPELFYDASDDSWLIFWASTIPGRFPETEPMGDEGFNHRIYRVKTRHFKTLSKPELFYDGGFNVIDASIVRDGDRCLMFLKDETRHPPAKNIRLATSTTAAGPYGPASPPITGAYWAEGPSAIRVGNRWIVYFDRYTEGTYGAVASADLEHWEDISARVSFPAGARHGTVFPVSEAILAGLLKEPRR